MPQNKVKVLPMLLETLWFLVLGPSVYASQPSQSKDLANIGDLLNDIKQNSIEMSLSQSEEQSELIINESRKLIFRPTGSLETIYTSQDSPQVSPFSKSHTQGLEYQLGFQKLWRFGVHSEISYTLQDRSNVFFNGINNQFLNPKLSLNLSTQLFQDILHDRYHYLEREIHTSEDAIRIQKKVRQKNILIQGLFDFSTILLIEEELGFQKDLCEQTRVQSKKLREKKKRQSISNREFYLSLRESQNCQATTEEIAKRLIETKEDFNATYSVSYEVHKGLNPHLLFAELERHYIQMNTSLEPVNMELKDEVQALSLQLEVSKNRQKRLEALAQPNLTLKLQAGTTGLDHTLASSHKDIGTLEYPFVMVSLSLGWPWSDPRARAQATANNYKTRSIEYKRKLLFEQSEQRLKTLRATLQKDFSIYKKYRKALKFSNLVVKEARADFNNGRIDFFSLTEFKKGLIQDQRALASHRIELLIRVIEFLDYHNYFNQYF